MEKWRKWAVWKEDKSEGKWKKRVGWKEEDCNWIKAWIWKLAVGEDKVQVIWKQDFEDLCNVNRVKQVTVNIYCSEGSIIFGEGQCLGLKWKSEWNKD